MSSFQVTAERLTIHPHPNADALELAQVGLYNAVVPKGAYQTGDWAVYIPEQAILPDALIEELGLANYLAGKDHNRVKAIRLRGELSQGIVCRPAALAEFDLLAAAVSDIDFAEWLGITKWVPEIPAGMNGVVKPAPELLPWVDIENVKRYPDVFIAGEPVIATEKVHGSACLVTVSALGEVWVSSKGYGEKNLAIEESDTNVYWRAVRGYDIPAVAARIAEKYSADRVGIFGEVYGSGIQDLAYGARGNIGKPGYAVFDIAVSMNGGAVFWLTQDAMVAVVAGELPIVPRLYDGPYDLDQLRQLAEGTEQMSGTEAHIREGVVVRSTTERHSHLLGGRAILKFVSDAYLTRSGNTTEFE